MDAKQRMAIPRQQPRELPVSERISNFDEVVFGFDDETARREAERCLQCKKPKCRQGCPIHNDIPGFIRLIREGKIEEAYWLDRQTNTLPAVCSRVCPHEFQCEGHCLLGKKGDPVAIGMLERYIVDWMVSHGKNILQPCSLPNGKKVAIVGSGPAGMSVAHYLAKEGYSCTIFESLPLNGGMLTVGIPPYRLPRAVIAAEFEALRNCGVEVISGVTIGKDKSLSDLKNEGFEAVFLGPGAHVSRKLGVDGEEVEGVVHGVDYLRRVNLGEKLNLGENVVVVGGGNVAIDCARTALRTGSKNVFILYRRGREEMPASKAEIHHLEEEGVSIETLAAPIKVHGENGRLKSIECIRMQLGACDASGRCRPEPVEGSNFTIEADAVIPAISQDVDVTAGSGLDLALSRWGTFEVDELTLQTTVPWVFAAGDAVLGPQTVAKAVFQAKEAAESIHRLLQGKDLKEGRSAE
ncbi:NAD(P)-dependent oxidoreductase [Desulfurivibrio alkaliphilus]|uniref:FAD-dependent pyridine nucleotide-disulfide oxidoreductase n=1 Tax=Desulfurivibrio alkaliphilus (strain DSM 19089 / UNIQEM U267 / AHT2) TaxID=589865 RepID=D6Z4U8_DESAT|nr:NAD(P)-dependent oxidoreductase [Desulfurivibrio alkaliphilus]ADH86573.1 FAD-dependent pyridine nucleotide-disulfide oxidoreductase [Desulfurivibrio alkaliphilus AHT 2]